MPYEIESPQQRLLTEQGALNTYGDRSHAGETFYVTHAYRDQSGELVWTYVRNMLGRHVLSHVSDINFVRLQ